MTTINPFAAGMNGWTSMPTETDAAELTQEQAEAILRNLVNPFDGVIDPGILQARESPPAAPRQAAEQSLPAVKRRATPPANLALFAAFAEALPDALILIDGDGSIVLANSQIAKLFGYRSQELLGQPIEVLVPERYRTPHVGLRDGFLADPYMRPMGQERDLYGRRKDGSDVPVEISLSPLATDQGTFVVASIRDITERRQTQSQLRSLEARYRTLVEGIPAVTFMAALDDSVNELYISPQIERLLGFSQQEWLANPILWYTQLHPDDRQRWHAEFAKTLATGQPFRSVYRFLSRDGRVVWVHGESKIVRDRDGQPLFLQGVAFDITNMKEAEENLRQANQTLEQRVDQRTAELSAANRALHLEVHERERAEQEVRRINADLARAHEEALSASQIKSQFLANMSHELRTPLNAIIGYSELLQVLAKRKGDDTFHADLGKINGAGKHLLTLINDILDLSKIEAGKMQLLYEPLELAGLIQETVETVEPLVAKNANTLTVDVADDLGTIETDVTRLRQCLLNLLSNACKFTREGTVSLSAFRQTDASGEWLVFRVGDTGIGMTPEQLGKLFEAFNQGDASTTRKFGGTGLGLTITRRIAVMMGGTITVESTAGKGSTFTLRIPTAPPMPVNVAGRG